MNYADILIEGDASTDDQHAPPKLPEDYAGEYISCLPKIPLPNGRFLFYARAPAGVVARLEADSRVAPSVLARSWSQLFFSNYVYWDWVFNAEVTDDSSHRVVKKLAQLKGEEIHAIYPPGVFAGDEVPELRAPAFVIDRYSRLRSDTQLILPAAREVSSRLFRFLQENPRELYNLRPRQFEEIVCDILAGFGWRVELTPESKDGGYDIFGVSGTVGGVESSWLIECKKYAPHNKVGVSIVRALCGVKEQLKVANAMIVTTSTFTRGAEDMATKRWDLALRDQEGVLDWLRRM